MRRGEVTGRGQIVQRLRRRQDAVTGGQGLGQGVDIVPVAFHGHHAAGPMIGRQNERRGGQAMGSGHAVPAGAMTTLATAEKSSRP